MRNYSLFDKICMGFDQAIRALSGTAQTSGAPYPGEACAMPLLSEKESKHVAGLMRVNHAGEVCAQGLYHGQAIVSRSPSIKAKMQKAAIEEGDHLFWCERRLQELGSHTSYANPIWYAGSFIIGMTAGIIGDNWSLGFVAETEKQVTDHLNKHMSSLPKSDQRSYQILFQMAEDEAKHRNDAIALGARELPIAFRYAMTLTSKVMVKTAYWI